MAKKPTKPPPKPRNLAAKALADPKFQPKILDKPPKPVRRNSRNNRNLDDIDLDDEIN